MDPMLGAQFVARVTRDGNVPARTLLHVLIGRLLAFVSFFARLRTTQIHPLPAVARSNDGTLPAGNLSHLLTARSTLSSPRRHTAAAARVTNGKQNVDRCIPSGRNPGGGAQR